MALRSLPPFELLDKVGRDAAVWLFAYGSLLFRPGFTPVETRRVRAPGLRRSFAQLSTDHRGTVETPGRVVTLRDDSMSEVEGLALLLPARDARRLVEELIAREQQGYQPFLVDVVSLEDGQTFESFAFVAPPENPWAAPELPLTELAELLRERSGPSGHNAEYVLQLVESLAEHQLFDRDAFELGNLLIDPEGAFADTSI